MATKEVMFRGRVEKIGMADFVIRNARGTIRIITNNNFVGKGVEDMNDKKVKITIVLEE